MSTNVKLEQVKGKNGLFRLSAKLPSKLMSLPEIAKVLEQPVSNSSRKSVTEGRSRKK